MYTTLPSKFQLGDDVEFTLEFTDDTRQINWRWGKITAVRFTTGKVWYEAIWDYDGKVYTNIPSHCVRDYLSESLVIVDMGEQPDGDTIKD